MGYREFKGGNQKLELSNNEDLTSAIHWMGYSILRNAEELAEVVMVKLFSL